MGQFPYGFNMPLQRNERMENMLAANFRKAETEAGAQAKVDAYATTASGLYIPKSLVDAKGDLLVGTAADTVARKAVGSDYSALIALASSSDGLAWSAKETAIAEQTGVFGANVTWHDLCSVTLTPGLWAVNGDCSSARIWHSGTGYVAATFIASLRVGSSEYRRAVFSITCQNEQRQEGGTTVQHVFDITTTTVVKLSGYYTWINSGGGANFASGFRTDSGNLGTPASIQAVRIR